MHVRAWLCAQILTVLDTSRVKCMEEDLDGKCIHKLCTCAYMFAYTNIYGVALVSRIDKIKGLFCKRALLRRLYLQKRHII